MNAIQMEICFDAVRPEVVPDFAPAIARAPIAEARQPAAEAPSKAARTLFALPSGFYPGSGKPTESVDKNLAALRLSLRLAKENRAASPKEKLVLAEYVGWGGLTEVFNDESQQRTLDALKRLVGAEAFEAMKHSTLNAHFTPVPIVRFVWECLRKIGFAGGRVLEPAVGVGNFLGGMPDEIAVGSWIHAVELDPMSARIFGLIYPEAKLRVSGYEDTALPDNFFDLAVGNVPFGDYRVADPTFPKALIHDYFFMKTLGKVRPGGLIAFITSSGTLDKANDAVRRYVAKRADLVAAVRFPETMMSRTARTTVTTDLIILRRLPLGANRDETKGLDWVRTEPFQGPGFAYGRLAHVNSHLLARREWILGDLEYEGWRNRVVCRERKGEPLERLLAGAMARMPAEVYAPPASGEEAIFVEYRTAEPTDRNGTFVKDDEGRLCIVRGGFLHIVTEGSANAHARIRGMMAIRDAARALLRARTDGDDAAAETRRVELNGLYDAFRQRHGFLNAAGNRRLFRSDPAAPLLLALEHYDADDEEATGKAALFEPMTLRRLEEAKEALDPVSAMAVCLNHRGRVDRAYLCRLTGLEWDGVWTALGGRKVFIDPVSRELQTAEEYLSGEVREKLKVARAAAELESEFAVNVAALEAVQPEDIAPEDIRGQLGASWIDTDTIRDFIGHLLDIPAVDAPEVTHLPALGAWKLSDAYRARGSVANTKTYGTDRYTALELVEAGLNLRLPVVYDEVEE